MSLTVDYQPSGSLTRLLLKNALLNFVTLLIYRFWAKTALRRYFWNGVRIGGDPLEFTGLGRELFVGFLIVLAVLAPLTIGWTAAESALQPGSVEYYVSQIVYFYVIYLLTEAAIFRARRYRLSRTLWRGIRAGQDGSTWRYVWLSFIWGLANTLTVCAVNPWKRVALQRYRMENTRFGGQYFTFDAPVRPLLKTWALVMVLGVLPMLALFAVAVDWAWFAIGSAAGGATSTRYLPMDQWVFIPASIVVALTAAAAYTHYRIVEFRHFTEHTHFAGTGFRSAARTEYVLQRVVAFVFIVVASLAFLIPIVIQSSLRTAAAASASSDKAALIITIVLLILAVAAGILVLMFLYRLAWMLLVINETLRHLCRTLTVVDGESLVGAAQTATTAPKYGEGLADSFEFGAT